MSAIDEYLKHVPLAQRTELERVRNIVKRAVPEAEEVITYGVPGFKYQKKYLIAFAEFKDHLSIFPGAGAIEAHKDRLVDFHLSKGTVQFTLDHQIPKELIEDMVRYRMDSISEK